MTILINSSVGAVTVNSAEHRVIGPNGVVMGTGTAVDFSFSSDLYSMSVMGLVSGGSRGIRIRENDFLEVMQGGVVESRDNDDGYAINVSGENAMVNISGDVRSDDLGLVGSINSDNLLVNISTTGTISGGSDHGELVNNYSAAIALFGDGSVVKNFGTIIGNKNLTTGETIAFTNAVYDGTASDFFDLDSVYAATFVNGGTVIGDVLFQAGVDIYRGVGQGHVDGVVRMGKADDMFYGSEAADSAFGETGADIMSGFGGNDRLNAGKGNDEMRGGYGADLLVAGGGSDDLRGGRGDDTLSGGDGIDTLNGGRGDDKNTGGAGNDTFVFQGKFGDDIIMDFSGASGEKIDLSRVHNIRNFNDLSNNHLRNVNGDAVITDGDGNSITLDGFAAGALQASDFIF